MSSQPGLITLELQVNSVEEIDPARHAQLTRQLVHELSRADVESVTLTPGPPPASGAKVVDPISIGAILLATLPVVLPKVLEIVQAWSLRGDGRTVKSKVQSGERSIEVEYPNAMPVEEAQMRIDGLMRSIDQGGSQSAPPDSRRS